MNSTLHVIMGFFWLGEELSAHLDKFVGEIKGADDGTFIGRTKDSRGDATIKGEIKGARLKFNKVYDPEARGAKGAIFYLLRTHSYDDAKKITCRGWRGVYKLPADQTDLEDGGTGQAACLIYPRP